MIWRVLAQLKQDELNIPKTDLTTTTFKNVLQVVFGVAGAIALLIITISALNYITSRGNPQEVAKAKNTIIYAMVGLVICILAFSIVTFVIKGV